MSTPIRKEYTAGYINILKMSKTMALLTTDRVVERVVRALYPYMVDTKDVRCIIREKLTDEVKSVIGYYQRHNGVILVQDNGKSQEVKTVGLLANLYGRIEVLEKENEELRFILQQPETKTVES